MSRTAFVHPPRTPWNVVLAEARHDLGLTVAEVARKTGFTNCMIRYYEELGVNPTMQTVFFYARALGLQITVNPRGVTVEGKNGAVLLRDWIPERPNYDD